MKIAFIEFTKSHEECIFSQIKFLNDAGYEITLIIHPKLKKQTTSYHKLVKEVKTYNFDSSNFFIRRFINLFKLYLFLIRGGFDKIIYNSASSKKEIIALNFLIPQKKIKSYGTIHNIKKINHSFSQRLISKNLKKYFVINDHLLNSTAIDDENLKFESYYPIYFPYQIKKIVKKSDDSIWICIPGELDYNRRDYQLILNIAASINEEKIKFIILGKVNKANIEVQQFFKEIEAKSIQDKFILFESFIDNDIFHSYLRASDFIFTPVVSTNENYFKYKITGAYNLAFAYKKPLLCDAQFMIIDDLKENSYFYSNEEELGHLLKHISSGVLSKKNTYKNRKWNYEYQKEKYLNFITD